MPLVEQQKAVAHGTLALHATAVHVPAAHEGVDPVHAAHAVPPEPQAPFAFPTTHCADVGSQHPPLQLVWVDAPQAVLHVPVDTLHACAGGQSAATLQPQAPCPPLGGTRHAEPFAFPTQEEQLGPHAVVPSATHAPP